MVDLRFDRAVVTGGRGFTDYDRILVDLRALRRVGLRRVAEGASNGGGADWLAHDAWREITGESTERYRVRADVDGRHRGAPAARNVRMLEAESRLAGEAGESLVVLAYPNPDSRGTWHCVKQAVHRGIPVACWIGPEYDFRGEAGMWRLHEDRPNEQVMSFGRADVVDFDCVIGENYRVIVVPSKGRGDDEALELGRAFRDALRQP